MSVANQLDCGACEGWGCSRCRPPNVGEQGPSAEEMAHAREIAVLRKEILQLAGERDAARANGAKEFEAHQLTVAELDRVRAEVRFEQNKSDTALQFWADAITEIHWGDVCVFRDGGEAVDGPATLKNIARELTSSPTRPA